MRIRACIDICASKRLFKRVHNLVVIEGIREKRCIVTLCMTELRSGMAII